MKIGLNFKKATVEIKDYIETKVRNMVDDYIFSTHWDGSARKQQSKGSFICELSEENSKIYDDFMKEYYKLHE